MGEKEEGNGGKREKGGRGMGEKMRERSWDAYGGGGNEWGCWECPYNYHSINELVDLVMPCKFHTVPYPKPIPVWVAQHGTPVVLEVMNGLIPRLLPM